MSDSPLKLKREVEPPQRANNGIGVILVASAAMFFAVAASAFVLRARMIRCNEARATPTHVHIIAPAAPAAAATPCGEPQIIDNGDGTQTVVFDACAAPTVVTLDGDLEVMATPLPADTALAVPDID